MVAEAMRLSVPLLNTDDMLNSTGPVLWRNIVSHCDEELAHTGNAERLASDMFWHSPST